MTTINNGLPVNIWHGITPRMLLAECARATKEQAEAMSYCAAMMDAGEPIQEFEFHAAENAFNDSRKSAIESYVGPIRYNRHGQYFGGSHPAL